MPFAALAGHALAVGLGASPQVDSQGLSSVHWRRSLSWSWTHSDRTCSGLGLSNTHETTYLRKLRAWIDRNQSSGRRLRSETGCASPKPRQSCGLLAMWEVVVWARMRKGNFVRIAAHQSKSALRPYLAHSGTQMRAPSTAPSNSKTGHGCATCCPLYRPAERCVHDTLTLRCLHDEDGFADRMFA